MQRILMLLATSALVSLTGCQQTDSSGVGVRNGSTIEFLTAIGAKGASEKPGAVPPPVTAEARAISLQR